MITPIQAITREQARLRINRTDRIVESLKQVDPIPINEKVAERHHHSGHRHDIGILETPDNRTFPVEKDQLFLTIEQITRIKIGSHPYDIKTSHTFGPRYLLGDRPVKLIINPPPPVISGKSTGFIIHR